LQKSFFELKNKIFAKIWSEDCKILYTLPRKSDSTKKLLSNFCRDFRYHPIFEIIFWNNANL
jgi:hypothetical protein